MDPAPNAPFPAVGPDWVLSIRCPCRIRDYIHAYWERHFAPTMTAARLCAKGRCKSCGRPAIEAAWERAVVGQGGLADGTRVVVR